MVSSSVAKVENEENLLPSQLQQFRDETQALKNALQSVREGKKNTAQVLLIINEKDNYLEESVQYLSSIQSFTFLGRALEDDARQARRRRESSMTDDLVRKYKEGLDQNQSPRCEGFADDGFEFDFGEDSFESTSEVAPAVYTAVAGDAVDEAMAIFLSEDCFGRSMRLPVVRIAPFTYVIGLLKYKLSFNVR